MPQPSYHSPAMQPKDKPKPNGYSESGDQVILTMSKEDYATLLMALGYATGAATKQDSPLTLNMMLKFLNRLNQGNPNYTPYATD